MTDKLTLAGDSSRDQRDTAASQVEQSEDRMRRALEQLGGASHGPGNPGSNPGRAHRSGGTAEIFAAPRKHRFVQDGDVSVTHVQGRRDRGARAGAVPEPVLAGSRDAFADERAMRQRAERAVQEAQAMIATLQTKLAHGDIALTEAREAARAQAEAVAKLQADTRLREAEIKSLQEKLDAAEEERQRLDQESRAEQRGSRVSEPQGTYAPGLKARPSKALAARTGRETRSVAQSQKARGAGADEPQPVKWWLARKP